MISIIICSRNPTLLNQLKLNIKETIGIGHEIIAINNEIDKEGICKVYNKGGELANYPLLCFIHEDILFETKNWGLVLINHLNDPQVGLVGLAGGDTKGLVPSSWSISFKSNEINLYQHSQNEINKSKHIFITGEENKETRKRVTALDGVFLCTRKEVFNQFKFDEQNLKGFHGYDIDYSLQVLARYNVMVIFDILVHHYSEGKPDKSWMESTVIISEKWKKQLPVSVYFLSPADFNFYHWKSLQVFLEHLFRLNYSYNQIIFYYLYYSFCRYFNIRRFLSMGKYVILCMYKNRMNDKRY